jgi:hypothetical protein
VDVRLTVRLVPLDGRPQASSSRQDEDSEADAAGQRADAAGQRAEAAGQRAEAAGQRADAAGQRACVSSAADLVVLELRLGPTGVLRAWHGSVSELLARVPGCSETTCFVWLQAAYLDRDALETPHPSPHRRGAFPSSSSFPLASSSIARGGSSRPAGEDRRLRRSEWHAWLAPFKEMQLRPVQVMRGTGNDAMFFTQRSLR